MRKEGVRKDGKGLRVKARNEQGEVLLLLPRKKTE